MLSSHLARLFRVSGFKAEGLGLGFRIQGFCGFGGLAVSGFRASCQCKVTEDCVRRPLKAVYERYIGFIYWKPKWKP